MCVQIQFPDQQLTLLAVGGVGGAGVQLLCFGGGGLMAVFLNMWGGGQKPRMYLQEFEMCLA